MQAPANLSTVNYVETTKVVEMRTRNIFRGSMALSVLLLVTFAFLPRRGGPLSTFVNLAFPPLLLWSFVLTGYAFHSMSVLASERKQLLEQGAVTDPTTGVKSLDYVRTLLEKQFENATRTGQPTAVIYLDLPDLRQVNRDLGRTVGDIVLKDMARAIEACVPEGAVVGRVGGDEFVVVLPNTAKQKAEALAESITQNIKSYRLDLGKGRQVDLFGCRIGIVGCPAEGGFADEILDLAQKASYQPSGQP